MFGKLIMPRVLALHGIYALFLRSARRIHLYLIVQSILLCSAALWSVPNASAADFRITFEMNERMRSAIISEPRRLKHVPRATIIVLHGKENGNRIRHRLGLDALVASSGYATVYPDALGEQWHNGLSPSGGPDDDVIFLRSLINKLVTSGITDPHRVYLVGASAGGMMALRFSCEASDMVFGTVAILANMPTSLSECKLTKPLPLLLMNGTADPVMPYSGGATTFKAQNGTVLSSDTTLDIFAKAAQCTGDRSARQFEDKDKEDKTIAFRETYAHCAVPVELIRVEGGGHALPGKGKGIGPSENIGPMNRDVETNKLIWDFIRRLPRN